MTEQEQLANYLVTVLRAQHKVVAAEASLHHAIAHARAAGVNEQSITEALWNARARSYQALAQTINYRDVVQIRRKVAS